MDKELLISEITLRLVEHCNIKPMDLKQIVTECLSDYSVSKLNTTLPSTGDGSTSMYLFSEFVKCKVAEGLSARTIKCYEQSANIFYSQIHKEFNLVTANDVIEFLDVYRLSGKNGCRKPNTVRNMYLNLSSFYKWMYLNKYIPEDIFANIKPPKGQVPDKKIVTESEVEKIVINLEEKEGIERSRDIALLYFLKDSGVRVSEFVSLNISDIDFSNRIVTVRNGKGGKSRETTFSEKTAERLLEYINDREDITFTNGKMVTQPDTPLFGSIRTNKRLSTDGVRDILKRMNSRLYPHLLRATCCTNLIIKGTTPSVVMSLMGHASMDMTNRYTKITADQLREAMKRIA